LPSRSSAIDGEEGPTPVKYSRARIVASTSNPANTDAIRSGRVECRSASATPGRALPAAQPQIEFTTIINVPRVSPTA
jgi:hypothetical protein